MTVRKLIYAENVSNEHDSTTFILYRMFAVMKRLWMNNHRQIPAICITLTINICWQRSQMSMNLLILFYIAFLLL